MRRARIYLLSMVTVFACLGNPVGADEGNSSLTRKQRREASEAVTHFRRARGNPEKQARVVREAIAAGPHAASALVEIIGKQARPQLDRYRESFRRAASDLAAKQAGEADPAEIAKLRQTVLSLQKDPDLTEEMIVEQGDPAMRRLAEIFLVNRMEVLGGSRKLQAERRKLQLVGGPWEQLALYLYNLMPEENMPEKAPSFERYLAGEEELAVGLAAPMDNATRSVLAANAALAAKLDPEEFRAILALNLTRNLLGLTACVIDLKLCATARDHSADMKKLKFFAHESPVEGKKTPWDRAKRFGASASAENIAMGYQDGRAANLGWFHSPGHHVNMLDNHTRVGMGRVDTHYTELFGR